MQFSHLAAQQYSLEIIPDSTETNSSLQALKPAKNKISPDSIEKAIENYFKKIELQGYLSARRDSLICLDSVCRLYVNPGKRMEFIRIYYDHVPELLSKSKEIKSFSKEAGSSYVKIHFAEIPDFMNALVNLFEQKGNSFVRISLEQIEITDNGARASVRIDQEFTRHIDKVVIKGYENFPKNFIDHELGLKTGGLFNKEKIDNASRAINNLPFAEALKPPEVLFTNDSTIVYLYIRKKKSNQFDGIIGFASKEDDNGIELNGYLDLSVNNIFNSGETIALYWKNNGQNRQRFYLETELPYLFGLPLTPKANFELYRQDSTFNNIRASISLLYSMPGKGQIAGHFSTENSNDLSQGNTASVNTYSNLFYGLSYTYRRLTADPLFPVRFQFDISAQLGTRKRESISTNQSKFLLRAHYLQAINPKNYIFVQNTSGILGSEDYLQNELFRIGGIYNLRGVNEESIFSSSYTVFNLEYRFKPEPGSYFYTITDYAYTLNEIVESSTSIVSFGLGYAFQTKAGILNLSYAVGKFEDTPFTFNNSKVHIKIVSKF